MRIVVLLALVVLAGCAAGPPAPCNPPMVVDQTGGVRLRRPDIPPPLTARAEALPPQGRQASYRTAGISGAGAGLAASCPASGAASGGAPGRASGATAGAAAGAAGAGVAPVATGVV